MDLNLKNKNALIMASSKGIGKAIAYNLASEGVNLYLCSRSLDLLTSIQADLQDKYSIEIEIFPADLSNFTNRENLINAVKAKYSKIDILVHNMGGPKPSTVLNTSIDEWTNSFNSLCLPVIHLNNAFIPGMIAQNFGRILAITSLSVIEPIDNMALSNSLRSLITAMLKTLANEIAEYNITVNCLAPGWIKTDRTDELLESRIKLSPQTKEQYLASHLSTIPANRMGSVNELSSLATFLCSNQAGYITGSTICVDGGKRKSTY